MFYDGFQYMNINFWSGYSPYQAISYSFMPASWFDGNYFNNFTMPLSNFQMPKFNFDNIWDNWNFNNFNGNISVKETNTDTFVKSAEKNYSTNNISADNILEEYNPVKGEMLANIALQGRQFNSWKSVPNGKEMCAFFVIKALEQAGMSNGMRGHAYQMADILQNNINFKQISPDNIDVNDLPAGCITVYKRGSQGYSEDFGHVEVTTGDGEGISQAITYNLKKPDAIFIPV